MRHRRAQHELGVRLGHELDGALARREDGQFAPPDAVRRSDSAVADGYPEHFVPCWRYVTPALAGREADGKVIDLRWRFDRAACSVVGPEQDTCRPGHSYFVRPLIEADGWSELEMRRQSHPELEAAGGTGLARATAVPHAVTGPHPLDTTRCQQTARAVGVLIAGAALGHIGQGGDTGMRVQSEAAELSPAVVEQVDEDERLQQFAEVARAGQARDRAMGLAGGAMDDRTQSSDIVNERVHGWSPDQK